MLEDGLLDARRRDLELRVARPHRLEERVPNAGEHGPVATERVEVAGGDAAAEVGVDVLHVLGLGGVDVAREVEIEIVLGVADLGHGDEAGVAGDF